MLAANITRITNGSVIDVRTAGLVCCMEASEIMAIPRAGTVLRGEDWKADELSEMRSLLQRAEQRMKKLNPASNSTLEDNNSFT